MAKAAGNKQAKTVAAELSGKEGYPETVTFEEVCNAVGKSPAERAMLTPEQQDEAAAKLKQTGTAPSPKPRRQRSSKKKSGPSPEQELRQKTVEWLEQVQIRAVELRTGEESGAPFLPSVEQDPHDPTMVRFADPCRDLLGVPDAMKSTSYRKYEEERDKKKNIQPWSGLLREKVKDGLQAIVPTMCPCGTPLRDVHQVTDEEVWGVLGVRLQLPEGGLRRTGMRRFRLDEFHPECRTMEEARVSLMIELEQMGGDTPEALALREERYATFMDEAYSKNVDKGATADSVRRAFEVFVLKVKPS